MVRDRAAAAQLATEYAVHVPDAHAHWEGLYSSRPETGFSWYQRDPATSLEYIAAATVDRSAPVIDVGGGASLLVDALIARGYVDLTVLDLSESALRKSRERLGVSASRVTWIAADVTHWQPTRRFQVWHDRAAFHFLTAPDRQAAYVAALQAATLPGATVIIATFALDGPEKCSGLPVQRYSPETLAARLGTPFVLSTSRQEAHTTPGGAVQRFSYAVFRRE
jgi:hypothetical protein